MSAPLIETQNLVKTYGRGSSVIKALDEVSLTIDRGEFVAVIGASGSGKSTLMNMLGGLDKPDGGDIAIAGQSLARMSKRALAYFRNETIGFVFQQFQLLPKKSALTNVRLPMQYRRPRLDEENERARQSLERVGLGDRIHHKPTQLSGGQQQRVAIARALVGEPDLLLADEPTGALDSKTSTNVMELLVELNRQGITIVLITHDKEVADYANRVIKMRDGKIVEDVRQGVLA
ncbi:MAG: ABC transporter ATP-binding protein [Henriciella sp.]|nr:ABC transporter ATP-binding protein [Henriciella sp.]